MSSTGTPEQGDFAFIPSQAPASHSVVAIPDKAGGTLTVTNTGQDDAEVTVSGYGPAGSYAGSKNITVKAGTSQVLPRQILLKMQQSLRWMPGKVRRAALPALPAGHRSGGQQ